MRSMTDIVVFVQICLMGAMGVPRGYSRQEKELRSRLGEVRSLGIGYRA